MPHCQPLWTADRLNEEIIQSPDLPVAFTPGGDVVRPGLDGGQFVTLLTADCDGKRQGLAAEIIPVQAYADEAILLQLRQLPAYIAICAIDPEPWCTVVIRAGARKMVGPFRDGPAPLREWLLRAVHSGNSIGPIGKSVDLPRLTGLSPTTSRNEARRPRVPSPNLVPTADGPGHSWLAEYLDGFDLGRVEPRVTSLADSVALASGLCQMNDFLDQSHQLSQGIEGAGKHGAGDYWHAIMHRREPDYSNAKYWFRRVGRKAFHRSLAEETDGILSGCKSPEAANCRKRLIKNGWDPMAFVDCCEALESQSEAELADAARRIQLMEMTLLLASTYHDAVT